MRFGKTLKNSIYEPWKSNYIDYGKLKRLLREDGPEDEEKEWTEDDEGKFVEELVNVQIEKVNAFQVETYKSLRERTSDCELRLENFAESEKKDKEASKEGEKEDEKSQKSLQEVLKELDGITKEINELEKYSRINYTGFLKAAKKHDRKRGSNYKVRPLLQVRLAALPFNSEDYSPLLYRYVIDPVPLQAITSGTYLDARLSTMYSFVRQRLDGESERTKSMTESKSGKETYTSHKCTYTAQAI